MFKYLWIFILVVAYIIWGIVAIKDIIDVIKECGTDDVEEIVDSMSDTSQMFIMLTLIGLVIASFFAFLFSIGE